MTEAAGRADPDVLLKRVNDAEAKSRRTKLKIYFGFAPGVGKTYAMLEGARRLRDDGVDVVVGCVETHGRPETEALVSGLTVLARREIEHRGVVLREFDLEAALSRKPAILLLDELAHTNAPGVRHEKRWQDALDLLDAGIEVHATLNVQHLESLNDVVAQITTVRVRETIPDAVRERADEIELVDVSAEQLLARLREGKIYVPEQAAAALGNFFRRGNLLALREIALRRTADLVDVDVRAYREEHGIGATWPAGERLVVAVGPSPSSTRLVRAARRMAEGLRAPWTAVWVEGTAPYGPEDSERLEKHLRLAESLGGEVARLTGAGTADTILRYAQRHNVTRLIVGKPTHSRLHDLVKGSLIEQLVRGSGGIDLHVISGDTRPVLPPEDDEPVRRSAWPDYFIGAEIVAIATTIAAVADRYLALPDIVMVYLVAIMLVAVRVGRGPSVLAASLSVAAYDFFFVPPRYTFAVSDTHHVLTFVVMLAVGIVLSELTVRVRTQARESRNREAITAALYALARDLGAAADVSAVACAICERAADAFDGSVATLLAQPGGGLEEVAHSGDAVLDARDLSVARWVQAHGRVAGLGSDTLPGARATCVPFMSEHRVLGVMVCVPRVAGRPPDAEKRHLLDALARQGALAIERVGLAADAEAADVRARTEALRSSLLSAVSHDLRTPLAAITGAASALRGGAPGLDAVQRDELADTISEESVRLERLVANLLDMTRLASGALDVKREWVPVEELVGGALTRLEDELAGREVVTSVAAGLPLLSVDPVLFEQVLVNLVDNAIKHTPPGTPIEIGARASPSGVAVEVADRGPGIPKESEELIFEKFRRGSDARARGSGLGLAICRGIVEAHGGTIRATGRTGGGTVFTVLLPSRDDTPGAPPVESGDTQ